MIGYGSLTEAASKERAWKNTGDNLPVRLRGFERSWTSRGTDIGFSTTCLGVRPTVDAEIVAALYRVYGTRDFVDCDVREYI